MAPALPPFLRQLQGDPLGLGRAAQSRRSQTLQPLTCTADRVPVDLPLLRGGLRAERVRQGREGGQIEGDTDSPISRGRLCPKGSASEQLVNSPIRETKVKYLASYAEDWQGSAWRRRPTLSRSTDPNGSGSALGARVERRFSINPLT